MVNCIATNDIVKTHIEWQWFRNIVPREDNRLCIYTSWKLYLL